MSNVKELIVTADDFGAAITINRAVEAAFLKGILTCASLMTGFGAATKDAFARARRMPKLGIGLHVAVTRAPSTLDPSRLPLLADAQGYLPKHLGRAGFLFFFSPRARRELEREIAAQFDAFVQSGLPCDHVNVHNHMHLHPTVLSILLRQARRIGVRHIRLPHEPGRHKAWSDRRIGRLLRGVLLGLWVRITAFWIRAAGFTCNRFLFGIHDTFAMSEDRVLPMVKHLPQGLNEIHFHPAYTQRGRADLQTLLSAKLKQTIAAHRIRLRTFRTEPKAANGARSPSAKENVTSHP